MQHLRSFAARPFLVVPQECRYSAKCFVDLFRGSKFGGYVGFQDHHVGAGCKSSRMLPPYSFAEVVFRKESIFV